MLNPLYAESITVDEEGPDGTFLTIRTEEIGTVRINIQDIVLEFEAEVYDKLHAYALEASHARAAVARGASLSEYLTGTPDVQEDAYEPTDPKSPAYVAAMEWKADRIREMEREVR